MDRKTIIKDLTEFRNSLSTDLENLSERRKLDGSIAYKTERNASRFYIFDEKHKSGLYINSANEQTLRSYCNERYYRKLESVLPLQIAKLKRVVEQLENIKDRQVVFEELPEPIKKHANPNLSTQVKLIEDFYTEGRYCGHSRLPVKEKHNTDRGETVRSKSELIIANMLYHSGIPYDYERMLHLKSGYKCPDFTILNVGTGKVCYLEHMGRMDEEEYRNKNLLKIEEYQASGIYQGEKLFLTFETKEKPLNTRHVRDLINHFFK